MFDIFQCVISLFFSFQGIYGVLLAMAVGEPGGELSPRTQPGDMGKGIMTGSNMPWVAGPIGMQRDPAQRD